MRMNLRMFGGFVFLGVLISMALGTPSDEVSHGGSQTTEHGNQSLVWALEDQADDHKYSAKTSNARNSYHEPRARDCLDILNQGHTQSGVYSIQPTGLPVIKAFCDMDTREGGWTVIQKRQDGIVDFYRDWLVYVAGFGDVYGEYWLGLHNIHILTHNTPMELFVYLEDFENNTRFAHYDFFAIASELNKYELDIGFYFGTAGDCLVYHRGSKFTTKDQDNASCNSNCAERYKGAWWYKSGYDSNLNGQYLKGQHDQYGLSWRTWKGIYYSLKTSVMMVRPKYYGHCLDEMDVGGHILL